MKKYPLGYYWGGTFDASRTTFADYVKARLVRSTDKEPLTEWSDVYKVEA